MSSCSSATSDNASLAVYLLFEAVSQNRSALEPLPQLTLWCSTPSSSLRCTRLVQATLPFHFLRLLSELCSQVRQPAVPRSLHINTDCLPSPNPTVLPTVISQSSQSRRSPYTRDAPSSSAGRRDSGCRLFLAAGVDRLQATDSLVRHMQRLEIRVPHLTPRAATGSCPRCQEFFKDSQASSSSYACLHNQTGSMLTSRSYFNSLQRALQTHLIDCYETYAASAIAANVTCRSICGAVFPLFAHSLYVRLGVNYASTLLAGIMLLLVPIPFVFER